MKYTCLTCKYSTNDKSNFNKHLKRKRKCVPKTTRKRLKTDQKTTRNDQKKAQKGTEKGQLGTKRHTKSATWHAKGTQNVHFDEEKVQYGEENVQYGEENVHYDEQKVQHDEENVEQYCVKVPKRTQQISNGDTTQKIWECLYCFKTFKYNRSWNRHMRDYCKAKSNRTQLLEQENAALRNWIANHTSQASNATNNITDHITAGVPERQWAFILMSCVAQLLLSSP